jgi:hypothetical protein
MPSRSAAGQGRHIVQGPGSRDNTKTKDTPITSNLAETAESEHLISANIYITTSQ